MLKTDHDLWGPPDHDLWGPPDLLLYAERDFSPGLSGRDVRLTNHLLLVPNL